MRAEMDAHGDVAGKGRPDGTSGLVGRRREMAEVRRLLPRTRLLTLTGAGGVGKSRLAGWAACALHDWFPGGVERVDLATVEDGVLLEPAVATALGLRDTGRQAMPVLVDHLADKRMLLLLDNCEHLLRPCAALVDRLLRGAPRLRILVTSRQRLGVAGEQILPVPTLPVPQPDADVRDVARCAAVRLFAQRAAEVRPGFAVDAGNAAAVARLARRLDGLPLAIELAAVRLRTTTVDDLLRGLDDRLDAPSRGGSGAPPRHRTLRATVDWSFELCSPGERRLWSRLAIFPGGVDLETAEEVCADAGIAPGEVLDLIAGLVDKSVLVADPTAGGVRYRMLDTIRAYGRERLPCADERVLHGRYRDHYRRMADRNRVDRLVPDQLDRYRAVRAELPNVRTALDLCFRRPEDAHTGLEIACPLWAYWILSGAVKEGRHWLERGLGLAPGTGRARATALWCAALIAVRQDDLPAVAPLLEECRALAERTGDETVRAQAVEISGMAALAAGDGRRGFPLMLEARDLRRAAGDVHAVAVNLYYTAAFGMAESPGSAADVGAELLALSLAHNALLFKAYAQLKLAFAAWRRGDPGRAETRMREAATVLGAVDDPWGLVQCLEVLGWTAGASGRHERAARLLGAAGRVRQTLDITPAELQYLADAHRDCAEQARRELGGRAFATAFRAGARLTLDRALAYALEEHTVGSPAR
ncbi:LuxR family transcriptional regulator [Actinomadura miaoliensis]